LGMLRNEQFVVFKVHFLHFFNNQIYGSLIRTTQCVMINKQENT